MGGTYAYESIHTDTHSAAGGMFDCYSLSVRVHCGGRDGLFVFPSMVALVWQPTGALASLLTKAQCLKGIRYTFYMIVKVIAIR